MAAGRHTSPGKPAPPKGNGVPDATPASPQPLTPRPVLFKLLLAVFAAWMGFLVYLYFTTIHPRRSVAPDGLSPAAPALEIYSSSRAAA